MLCNTCITLLLAINSYFLSSLKLCDLVVVGQQAISSEYPLNSNKILNQQALIWPVQLTSSVCNNYAQKNIEFLLFFTQVADKFSRRSLAEPKFLKLYSVSRISTCGDGAYVHALFKKERGNGGVDSYLEIASRLSRAKIKCSICSSQFNTWDAQHRWALVLIVCLNRG